MTYGSLVELCTLQGMCEQLLVRLTKQNNSRKMYSPYRTKHKGQRNISTFDRKLSLMVEVLLCIHRNRRLIRDGSPGRPPRLSHSSWSLGKLSSSSSGDDIIPPACAIVTRLMRGPLTWRRQFSVEDACVSVFLLFRRVADTFPYICSMYLAFNWLAC